MRIYYFIIIALLFCLTSPSYATIYKWVDNHGETHFTDNLEKIPERSREKAKDFDKIEHQGSVTYDPELKSPEPQEPQTGEEPFWKRYLQQEEEKEQAKRSKETKITLYMTDW